MPARGRRSSDLLAAALDHLDACRNAGHPALAAQAESLARSIKHVDLWLAHIGTVAQRGMESPQATRQWEEYREVRRWDRTPGREGGHR